MTKTREQIVTDEGFEYRVTVTIPSRCYENLSNFMEFTWAWNLQWFLILQFSTKSDLINYMKYIN